MAKKRILLNAFNMNCVGHINHGLWTHPRDRSSDYNRLDYWTSLAATLERGLFDGLFLADLFAAGIRPRSKRGPSHGRDMRGADSFHNLPHFGKSCLSPHINRYNL